MRSRDITAAWLVLLLTTTTAVRAADWPTPVEGDHTIREFRFASGQTLPDGLRIHYRTLGTPRRDAAGHVANAVLVLHGTSGDGTQFLNDRFAGQLFGPGQLLDATRFFLVLPDGIGHGKSSRPSDGLHAHFPDYRYADMVAAQHALLVDGLHVDHLRLVIGTSMGGMHTWMWGEAYPDFADALMPLASLPVQISGRNRMWRRMIADAIRTDPAWAGGEYKQPPPGLRVAAEVLTFMGSNPRRQAERYPTGQAAIDALEAAADRAVKRTDANDLLYAVEASLDYDPSAKLEQIKVPLVAVNSADDLINPPDLGVIERETKRVPHGRAVLIPEGPDTDGHGTHTIAKVWKGELERLLAESERT